MISIIICSRSAEINQSLQNNIQETIGVPYEIVLINNATNKHTIFSAYNEGVKQSKYPYLCFMHDDICYNTGTWGQKVIDHFNEPLTGAIGIAGSPYVALMPGSWWAGALTNINIIPWYAKDHEPQYSTYPQTNANKSQVISLDGVWFCIKRQLFDSISFDESNFSGFHLYDIDINFQVYQSGFKSYCVFDILIEHYSKGDMNLKWCENAIIFKNKWNKYLPVSCVKLSFTKQCKAELATIKELVMVMLQNHQPHKKVYKMAFAELSRFYKGYFYPPILLQLAKYLIGSLIH